ncbi:hypothetical protein AB0G35_24315 [Streptomyces sp. NPDC021749]|uniref:hypothetical protein n=1 Tax=Streptomyces sp. NPDC021749 TaxID=3154905 RepID=UPI0034064B95
MDVVRVLLLILIGSAIWVGWRLYSFPGGWGFAFGAQNAGEREHLAAARRKWRDAESSSYRRVTAAKEQEHRAQTLLDARIRSAEKTLQQLRQPGRGELVEERGPMALHRHVLLIAGEEIPLAGLRIRFEQDRKEHHIYATRPDGTVRLTSFPHAAHEEGHVRRFAVGIENAVAEENAFRAQRKALMTQAEKELQKAQADTGARDAARLHVEHTTSLHQHDRRRKAARAELDAARSRWQSLTGKLPH